VSIRLAQKLQEMRLDDQVACLFVCLFVPVCACLFGLFVWFVGWLLLLFGGFFPIVLANS
jgi:hypothetical protein